MTTYQRITILLTLRGSSTAEMLSACGITRQAYSNWKCGKRNPRAESLQKIADFIGVTVEDLISEKSDIVPESVKEKTLLQLFRSATPDQQDMILIATLNIMN